MYEATRALNHTIPTAQHRTTMRVSSLHADTPTILVTVGFLRVGLWCQTCAPPRGMGHCAPGPRPLCPCRTAGTRELVVGEMASRPRCAPASVGAVPPAPQQGVQVSGVQCWCAVIVVVGGREVEIEAMREEFGQLGCRETASRRRTASRWPQGSSRSRTGVSIRAGLSVSQSTTDPQTRARVNLGVTPSTPRAL